MEKIYAVRVYKENTIFNVTKDRIRKYNPWILENHFYDNNWAKWMDEEFLFKDEEQAITKFNEEIKKAETRYNRDEEMITYDIVEMLSFEVRSIQDFTISRISDNETVENVFCKECH